MTAKSAQNQKKPLLRSIDSYIPAINIAIYLEGKQKILLVGDAGGRDWQYLKSLDKEIHIVDISPQADFPNLVVQSIEEKTPFPDEFFDGAVMGEVLEHLFYDVTALHEVHRILKPDGVLVITVPYYSNTQDSPEFHVRIHSFKTIRRLLENCGFEVKEHFYRGLCSRLPQINKMFACLIYFCQKSIQWVTNKSPDDAVDFVNDYFNRIERFLGSHAGTAYLQRFFTSYGGILKAIKGPKKNYYEIQKSHFSS